MPFGQEEEGSLLRKKRQVFYKESCWELWLPILCLFIYPQTL